MPGLDHEERGDATDGLAGARVVRAARATPGLDISHRGELRFLFVLEGRTVLRCAGTHDLEVDDAVSVPPHTAASLQMEAGTELLEVSLPGAFETVLA